MVTISPERRDKSPLWLRGFVSLSLKSVGGASKGLDLTMFVVIFHTSLSSHEIEFPCL